MMFVRLFLQSLAVLSFGAICWGWGYNGPGGPDHWCQLPLDNNQCCGSRQSPINIDTSLAVPADFFISTAGLDHRWEYVNVTNDKHTVVVHVPEDASNNPSLIILYQNDLSDTFLFDSLHFHFGISSDVGAEHQIDGQIAPMEMHTVFYNSKYPSFTDAKLYSDGIIVVGVHFYISAFDNMYFAPLTDAFQSVLYVDETYTLTPGFAISNLLPDDLSSAYSYQGSLTTPVCNEAVQWFVLKVKVPISENQMDQYRTLTVLTPPAADDVISVDAADIYMSGNFRPTQALNGRTIYDHTPN